MSDISVGSSGSGSSAVDKAQADIAAAAAEAAAAAKAAQEALDKMNAAGLKDEFGHPLHFNTLAEWKEAWQNNRRWQDAGGHTMSMTDLTKLRGPFDNAVDKAAAAQQKFSFLSANAISGAMLSDLLANGDLEGALLLLQSRRVELLDKQMSDRMAGMKTRNDDIATLNKQMDDAMAKPAGTDKEKLDRQTAITSIQNKLSDLNNTSQLDMIGLQQIVSKRNESFDLLTNLLGKFQKTMDGIVSNMR